jgi:ABC-type phosphate/phosphonate transport system permease subunit
VQLSRLRRGEIIAVLSALVLVALMFAVPWFQFSNPGGGRTSANAWTTLPTLRWVLLVAAASAVLLGYLQASRTAPALPVTVDVIVVTFSAIVTVILLIRILTGEGSPLIGAFAGLAAIAVQTTGAFMSLRQEGGWTPGPDHPIETIALGGAGKTAPRH